MFCNSGRTCSVLMIDVTRRQICRAKPKTNGNQVGLRSNRLDNTHNYENYTLSNDIFNKMYFIKGNRGLMDFKILNAMSVCTSAISVRTR